MTAEIIELTDRGLPGAVRKCDLIVVPRIGELLTFGELYFEVVNVIHHLGFEKVQPVSVFVRDTKPPYQEPKTRFGFGAR